MSFDYADLASTANDLLTEFGALATLKRTTTGAYDPATGTTPVTQTSQAVTAAVFDYAQQFINGTEIRTGDKQVYMSAVGVDVPLPGDVFTWQGVDYTVIKITPLAPGAVDVMHTLQVRK